MVVPSWMILPVPTTPNAAAVNSLVSFKIAVSRFAPYWS